MDQQSSDAVTKENIANVEAELAALQKLIDGMSVEGKSYMWNAKQLGLIKTIVADYHIELAGKQGAFKADMPADLRQRQSTIRLSRSAGAAWITRRIHGIPQNSRQRMEEDRIPGNRYFL